MRNGIPSKDELSIVLCGEAGQGIQTVEYILAALLKRCGYNFFSTKEYMSRVRGGSNSTGIRVSTHRVNAFVDRIDILFPLTSAALAHVSGRIADDTLIVGERSKLFRDGEKANHEIRDIPFSRLAREVGGEIFTNTIAVGIVSGLLRFEREITDSYLQEFFHRKGEEIIRNNLDAFSRGYEIGVKMRDEWFPGLDIRKNPDIEGEIIVSGAEAIGMGALCGGCTFAAAYPMTPSTGILTFLSGQTKNFDIIVEQAEDEIAAVNMALGAWYAGGRGFVCTAGGGFALMAESLSLSGMTETPVVLSVGQRPAPATGLPTRTEQGDLSFALHAGHGEFPRVIYAPGTLEDCFHLTRKAFEIADTYQVPVIILSDQYLIDSYYNFPRPDISGIKVERHIVETGKDYRRYALTDTGVSPRGIPGWGEGYVVVDSDEHTEEGHITESPRTREAMVDKRLLKHESLKRGAIPPEMIGERECSLMAVCWGSNYHIVREAILRMGRGDVSLLHFAQVYPLHPGTTEFFKNARDVVIIENNATAQFSRVLQTEANVKIEKKILKYNGLPFSVEELTSKLNDAARNSSVREV